MNIRWLPVLRDVLIVFASTFIGGFLVGFLAALLHWDSETYAVTLGLTNILFGSIGFLIAGLLVTRDRWAHLCHVGFASWLLSLVNLAFGVSLIQWLFAIVFIAVMMAIGGGMAALIRPGNQSGAV